MSTPAGTSAPASTLTSPHLRRLATADLQRVLSDLTALNPDLVGITMRAKDAFRMLGAQAEVDDLTWELAGYPEGVKLPHYRSMAANAHWETTDTRGAANEALHHDPGLADRRVRVEWVVALATWFDAAHGNGVRFVTGATKTKYSNSLQRRIHWSEVNVLEPSILLQQLDHYRAQLHDRVGKWVVTLLAGEEAASLWDTLRESGDALATKAGVGDGLQAIVRAALGDDPSSWRSGLLACRNVINDLSRYLYQAPGKTYPYITIEGREMEVDGEKYRNRLIAYLQQKGLDAADRNVARQHLEWFAGFVAMVNDLGSSGKAMKVDKRDMAIGLMHTYLLIGEIAARTDGEPLRTLVDPASEPGSS